MERLYRAFTKLAGTRWPRIKELAEAAFKRELTGHTLKIGPKAGSAFDDAARNGFIFGLDAIVDRTARQVSFRFGMKKPDEWMIRNEGKYTAIRTAALALCESTLDDIEKSTGEQAAKMVEEIRKDVMRTQFGGQTVRSLSNKLAGYFAEEVRWKARRIARTEAARGHNVGYQIGTQDAPWVTGYQWVMSDDACPLCQRVGKVDGRPRRWAKGGLAATDPAARREYQDIPAAPLHPNCMCSVAAVLEMDEVTDFDPPANLPALRDELRGKDDKASEPNPAPTPPPPPAPVPPPAPTQAAPAKPAKAPRKPKAPNAPKAPEAPKKTPLDDLREKVEAARKDKLDKDGSQKIETDTLQNMANKDDLGEAKIRAILEYGDKHAPEGLEEYIHNDELLKANSNRLPSEAAEGLDMRPIRNQQGKFMLVVELMEQQRKIQDLFLNQVRSDVFSILKLPESDRMKVKRLPEGTAPRSEPLNDELRERVERVESHIMQAVGPAASRPSATLVTGFGQYSKPGLERANGDADPGGTGIRLQPDAPASTIAHEIGHILSVCNFYNPGLAGGLGGVSRFEENPVVMDTIRSELRNMPDEKMLAIRNCAIREKDSVLKENNWYMREYSQEQYRHMGLSEVPSTLMDYFYHNPVQFVRHMPKPVTKAVLGLMEGSWR